METVMYLVVLSMVVCLAIGLSRIVKGSTNADGILALQFSSTVGVGLFPLVGVVWSIPTLLDIALIAALLGVPVTLAFARLSRAGTG